MAADAAGVIVVAGEALVDMVPAPDGERRAHPGGGPFNIARTIGRLEAPVAYLGRISSDRHGEALREQLAADGVKLEAIVSTGDPTTLAVAELDADGVASYRFEIEGTSAPGLTPEEALAALPTSIDILQLGSLGLVLEPIATALEAVVEAVPRETLVALDPNCRPGATPDATGYRRRIGRILRRAQLVKLSDDDLAFLEPERPPLDAARGLLDAGPSLVLLTRGAEGAVAVTAGEELHVPAPAVKVVDTVGAGDAFGGAFLAWWHSQGLRSAELTRLDEVAEGTRFACAAAAMTCERAGALPPRRAELTAWLAHSRSSLGGRRAKA
jgi:fructokinase